MTYYEILEVSETASEEVIRMAYKALVKKYHPDVFKGDSKEAEMKMKKINEAFEVLSNADKRKQYDSSLHKRRDYAQIKREAEIFETHDIVITKNINKTRRIINDADIIRANNEKDIEELKFAVIGLKVICFLMVILLIVALIHIVRNIIETISRDEPYVETLESSFKYKNDNYVEVVASLEEAGFEYITVIDLNDATFFKKENTVSKITINGEDSFSKSEEFPKSSEVVVYYH